jgi:excisionase family DNA binding protein
VRKNTSVPAQGTPGRRWASITEAAEYLGVTTRTIRAMGADGRITTYHCGTRLVRVDLAELDDAMRAYGGAVGNSEASDLPHGPVRGAGQKTGRSGG